MSGRDKSESAMDLCRARQEEMISIRKNKRIESLNKRRAMAQAANNPTTDTTAEESTNNNQVVNAATNGGTDANSKGVVATIEDLPRIAAQLKSMTPEQRFEATRSVRRLLSRQEQPPAADVIKAGLVPLLVAELGLVNEEKTQFEAAWALTNIASTEHTRVIVQHGAVPYLVKLMMSKNPDIREQSLWCLGNVSGDGHDMRDLVLKVPNALNNLLMNIKHAATPSLIGNATWTLSNFCRGKPQPAIEMIQPALPYLAKLIQHPTLDIVGDACWALSYISDGDDDRIQACLDLGIVPTLTKLLASKKVSVVTPALRTLGNIVSGNDVQTQAVIDAGVFAAALPLLHHVKCAVRKEAAWALSNIAAGTPAQVDMLVSQRVLLKRVMELLETDDFDVRKEAAWVISNICTGGSSANIDALVGMGALKVICAVLDVSDVKISQVALEALEAVLRKSGKVEYATLVEELGGVDKLEALQGHNNDEIYRKAVNIIEVYYGGDDDDDDDDDDDGAADSNDFFNTRAKANASSVPFGAENANPAIPAAKGDIFSFGSTNSTNNNFQDPFSAGFAATDAPALNWGF